MNQGTFQRHQWGKCLGGSALAPQPSRGVGARTAPVPFGDHEPRHTVRYAVLASASKVRAHLAPKPAVPPKPTADVRESPRRGAYRPWAELLTRTFGFDVLTCPCCSGRMKLLALVTDPTSVARYLRGIGEPTDVPKRTPARGPPYWASRVLRRGAGSVEAAE